MRPPAWTSPCTPIAWAPSWPSAACRWTSALELLQREHQAWVASLGLAERLLHSLASLGMYIALYTLCGLYVLAGRRYLLCDARKLGKLLLLIVLTIALCKTAAPWRAEIIPLLLFAMTAVIVFPQELALLLCASTVLIVVVALGFGLAELVICTTSMATAVMLLRRVRSRTKLIYVGLCTGAATAISTLGVGVLAGWPPAMPLLINALWYGCYALLAGLLMTSLLPFVERLFDVQTEISLLELGDVAHPLLQELVRRPPGLTTTPSMWRRSPKPPPTPSTPTACWSESVPTSTTSAKCSSQATSSKTRGKMPTGTRR